MLLSLLPIYPSQNLDSIGNTYLESLENKHQDKIIKLSSISKSFAFIQNIWFLTYKYYLTYYYFNKYPKNEGIVGYTYEHQLINAWFSLVDKTLEGDNIFDSLSEIVTNCYKILDDDINKKTLNLLILIGLSVMREGGFTDDSGNVLIQQLVSRLSYYDDALKEKNGLLKIISVIKEQFELSLILNHEIY